MLNRVYNKGRSPCLIFSINLTKSFPFLSYIEVKQIMQSNVESLESGLINVCSRKYSHVFQVNIHFLNVESSEKIAAKPFNKVTMKETEGAKDFSFLVPISNFLYYIFISPFKMVMEAESNQYCLQSSLLHKVC